MKTISAAGGVAFAILCLAGCSLWHRHSSASQPTAPVPAATPEPKAQTERFTGKVVLAEAGYRLQLLDDESGALLKLTRAKRHSEFAAEQINLRKYYEKTIVVRGRREGDWIWAADIVGQWNKPGESRGPNTLAPPMPNR